MHDCQRDSHATSQTAIYANIMQTGRIFEYEIIRLKSLSNHHLKVRESTRERVREEDIFD